MAETCPRGCTKEVELLGIEETCVGWFDKPGHIHNPNRRREVYQCLSCGVKWYSKGSYRKCPACGWSRDNDR